jgi:hypothetical protein
MSLKYETYSGETRTRRRNCADSSWREMGDFLSRPWSNQSSMRQCVAPQLVAPSTTPATADLNWKPTPRRPELDERVSQFRGLRTRARRQRPTTRF